jgi:hypothetical protein
VNRRAFVLAGASSLVLPLIPTLAQTALAAPAAVASISASTVLTEAQHYLGIPYRYGGIDPAVGLDCSAYVSLTWQIPRQTTDTIQGYSYPIAKSDLLPGDALNRPFVGRRDHIRLFAGWATADQTIVWVYEAARAYGVSYHVVAYDDSFTPIRRNNFSADVPMPTLDLPLDYDVPNGHFYSQTGGDDGLSGFTVSNANHIRFWSEFRRLGGVDVIGLPLTGRFDSWGQTVQVFQNGVLHWDPDQLQATLGPSPSDLDTAAPPEARAVEQSPLLVAAPATSPAAGTARG